MGIETRRNPQPIPPCPICLEGYLQSRSTILFREMGLLWQFHSARVIQKATGVGTKKLIGTLIWIKMIRLSKVKYTP